jgi:PAS domain S-box-containing protein
VSTPSPSDAAYTSSSSAPIHTTAEFVAQLLDISPDALIIVDNAGTIVKVNNQAEMMFGYSSAELVGQSLEILLPERFRKLHIAHRAHYARAPRTRPMGAGLELYGKHKDGLEFPVDISLRPLILDGTPHVVAAVRDITAQKQVESENAQRLQQLRLQTELMNLSHDAILIRDPINRIIFWNRGAEELYGWTAQEALGRISHTLLKTRFPLDQGDANQADEALEREGHWEGELIHKHKDGHTLIVESSLLLVRDKQQHPIALLEINRDVTERYRQEQAVRSSYAETVARLDVLQQIINALPSSVYLVYGPETRLALSNRTTDTIWGAKWHTHQPMREFLTTNGIGIFDIRGRPLPYEQLATLRALQQGECVLQHQETIRRPDGSSIPVLVNAVTLNIQHPWLITSPETGETIQVEGPLALVVHQEVTELKEAEYLKDEFVGIAAHELRTPLAILKGYADMLIVQTERQHGPPLADWQVEALNEIKEATARLTNLTEELLEVTRLQAGRLVLSRLPTDLVALTRRVSEHLQKTTTRHQITLDTDRPTIIADIDPGRIEQILINLIGNAIKYSPQGGPIQIRLWQEENEHLAHLSVQDRGIGIPEHEHGQIFGRFMRADNARARGINGTGLGLYLSRELALQHGGALWFQSTEGVGSTFFLTLPLATETDQSQDSSI